ncbi:hypothetical protein FNB15_15560 [Ferrovibrio terrae]|uniref:Uncharacterized protein n=1 Tax=Ferrovibrio terrae TaxID=2594003 RepID=A0A516H4A4_9PROT|nr:hypothetical protein [Ferrovibrio terrae]QDO98608.1 hypothetical protein FNB15_15560 [Ferrovibrio terrae]
MDRVLAPLLTGRSFLVLMALATIGPVLLAALHLGMPGSVGLAGSNALRVLELLAAPHVFTTLYLLVDARELVGVPRPLLTLLAIPLLLMAATTAVLVSSPLWMVTAFMLFYTFFGMWHFGRQNFGVVAFATRISYRRPMGRFERHALNAGNVAGLLAGYHIFAPVMFTLNPQTWPLDLSRVDPVFSLFRYGGLAIYAVLIPCMLYYLVANWRRHEPFALVIFLGCVFFFLPTYLSTDPLLVLVAWAVAHGLQYVLILGLHAAGRATGKPERFLIWPLVLFAAVVLGGVVLWRVSGRMQLDGGDTEIRLAVSFVVAITLVHYWVERYLWRFSSPARRAWLEQSFRFLSPPKTTG